MLKESINRIWKDPVWSKVISVGIVALLTLLYNLFSSIKTDTSFKDSFLNFWTFKIDLWVLLVIILVFFGIPYYLKRHFKYTDESLEIDRRFFNDIRNKDGILDLVLEIKTNGFSSRPVKFERIETLIDIIEESKKPDFEFLNPTLNKLKDKVILELQHLDSIMNSYIFGANNGWVAIPSEWEFNQPERMQKAITEIEKQENIFTKTYQNFISKGRQILKT